MNNLILLCLIILMCLRGIGLGVSIDFYQGSKDSKFILFMLCWSFWIIANIFPLPLDMIKKELLRELFLVLNITCALVGFTFYVWGFFDYYMGVPSKLMVIILISSSILPFLMYIVIGFSLTITVSSFFLYILLFNAYIIPPLKKRKFSEFMGKSERWYYATISVFFLYFPISAITFSSGYQYGLYYAEDPILIMLYYVPPITSTVLLILLLVHLEYTISSREKFQLKDTYSHDLGNIMQVVQSSLDLIRLREKLSANNQQELNVIEQKCLEASKLVKNIRQL